MDFGEALAELRTSQRVTRDGWNGNGMWIALSPGAEKFEAKGIWSDRIREQAEQNGGSATFRPYIMMKTVDDEFVPWVASQTDLLAWDWRVFVG